MVNESVSVDEVRRAADTLEKMSRLYEYVDPNLGEWSASDLRSELNNIAEYEAQHRLRSEIAATVERKVFNGSDVVDAVRNALIDFELTRIEM